jgi:hypothetical protein
MTQTTAEGGYGGFSDDVRRLKEFENGGEKEEKNEHHIHDDMS